MKVLVVGLNGIGLMPTTPRKARILLKCKKAVVIRKNPFTIRLLYKTGSATRDLSLGIDTGESHIGIAVTDVTDSTPKVICKSEIILRSSMEKRKLMETRKVYRRSRRYRKVRYRKCKFKHKRVRTYGVTSKNMKRHWYTRKFAFSTNRPDGWLPPSIQSKVDHHIFWINKYISALPKNTRLVIEVARFDVAHMKNPSIHGEMYRHGRMYEYENVKAYVLAKFDYKCAVCGHKFDNDHKAKMHHITYKSKGAANNPDEYAPVCEKCHTPVNHLEGAVIDKLRKSSQRKGYREPVFINILRRRLFTTFSDAILTYGNITNADRKALHLDKSHVNDAVAISLYGKNTSQITDTDYITYFKQIRSKKRSLHEANPRKGRKVPNFNAKRNNKNVKQVDNFHVYDKVAVDGKIGYITGFSGKSAYVTDFFGRYLIPESQTYKQINLSRLSLLQIRTNNYITMGCNSSPKEEGISC